LLDPDPNPAQVVKVALGALAVLTSHERNLTKFKRETLELDKCRS